MQIGNDGIIQREVAAPVQIFGAQAPAAREARRRPGEGDSQVARSQARVQFQVAHQAELRVAEADGSRGGQIPGTALRAALVPRLTDAGLEVREAAGGPLDGCLRLASLQDPGPYGQLITYWRR